jgi:hypothetical protein
MRTIKAAVAPPQTPGDVNHVLAKEEVVAEGTWRPYTIGITIIPFPIPR